MQMRMMCVSVDRKCGQMSQSKETWNLDGLSIQVAY